MKYLLIGLLFVFFVSCGKQNGNIGYRIEQFNNNDGSYFIQLLDKNNSVIGTFNFTNDSSIISFQIVDESIGFYILVNLAEGNIASYMITDGTYSKNTELNNRLDGLILSRTEIINENIAQVVEIDINGVVRRKETLQNVGIAYNSKFEQFLVENNIPINYIGGNFNISSNIKKCDLIAFLRLLRLEMDVIADNITNVHTTRTYAGGPFIRNLVVINDGKIEIIEDNSPTQFVYDPTHPDSIYTGEFTGYVEFPNVNIVTEMFNLITVNRIYKNIMEKIKLKNIHKQAIIDYFYQ